MAKIATQCINFFLCTNVYELQNSMEVDSMGIIAILSMLYITTRIVKT